MIISDHSPDFFKGFISSYTLCRYRITTNGWPGQTPWTPLVIPVNCCYSHSLICNDLPVYQPRRAGSLSTCPYLCVRLPAFDPPIYVVDDQLVRPFVCIHFSTPFCFQAHHTCSPGLQSARPADILPIVFLHANPPGHSSAILTAILYADPPFIPHAPSARPRARRITDPIACLLTLRPYIKW